MFVVNFESDLISFLSPIKYAYPGNEFHAV